MPSLRTIPKPIRSSGDENLPQISHEPNYGTDFSAHLYSNVSKYVQTQSAIELLQQLDLEGSELVLDSGAGDGYFTAQHLAKQVSQGRVIGVDQNAEMIHWARAQYLEGKGINCEFIQADIRKVRQSLEPIGISPGSFDVVFSNYTHHWMFTAEDKERAYTSIAGELRVGGILADRLLREGSFSELIEPALEVAKSKRWRQYFMAEPIVPRMPSVVEVEEALAKSGFREVRLSQLSTDRVFPNKRELTRWFAACFRTFMTPIASGAQGDGKSIRREQLLFARDVLNEFDGDAEQSIQSRTITEKLTQILATR